MGLLDWLTRRVAQKITTGRMIGGPAVYPDAKSSTWIEDGYSGNAAIYTIISHSAKKFANVPRCAYKPDEVGKKAIKAYKSKNKIAKKEFKAAYGEAVENDLDVLLKRPNPNMGGDTFWEAVYTSYDLQGEAFIWLNRGLLSDGVVDDKQRMKIKPLEMYWLPPQFIDVIPAPDDVWGVIGYELNLNGKRKPLAKADVIHWKKFNPNFNASTREHLRGLSPLEAGVKLMTADDASVDAQVAMHQNDGAKGILSNETLDNLTPVQESQLRGVVNSKINNRDLKGSVATLQGKWDYHSLGGTSVDMQLLAAQDVTFARLCNLFRVSPNLFISGQTRDNLREARKELITGKIMPDATSLDDELNRQLKEAWPGLVVASDFCSLPEMQYEMDTINTIYEKMWMKGVVTIDEWREAMGFDLTGEEAHSKYFVTGMVTPIDEAGMPPLEEEDENQKF